jgi:predicted restriction endonuclease
MTGGFYMQIYNISDKNVEFKNLVSGPAPVGRILNYLILAGNDKLNHKNGYRYTNLKNNIGYAWTTELMIGLGLVKLGSPISNYSKLEITRTSKKLFEILNQPNANFNEGSDIDSIINIKEMLKKSFPFALEEFEMIFRNSYVFMVLKEYLNKNGFYYTSRKDFMNDYFATLKRLYDSNPTPYNYTSRTTTAENRVPSIIQICQLFDYVIDDGSLTFKSSLININNSTNTKKYTLYELENELKKEEEKIKVAENMEQFGVDGNVIVTSIVRNSVLQQMFKHNLSIDQNHRCVICKLSIPELLIGSHIKPAVESTAKEKLDENNGLLLCCNHDKLFDRHLITFDSFTGEIKCSKILTDQNLDLLNIDKTYKLPDEVLTDERKVYLLLHNLEFENKEAKR